MNSYYFNITTTTGQEFKNYWLDATSLEEAWKELVLIFTVHYKQTLEQVRYITYKKNG